MILSKITENSEKTVQIFKKMLQYYHGSKKYSQFERGSNHETDSREEL